MKVDAKYLQGCASNCPLWIIEELVTIDVSYLNFLETVQSSTLIVHQSIAKDLLNVFQQLLKIKFAIYMIKPLHDPQFLKNGEWNDELSMNSNNTSVFNYRTISGKRKLSTHALGMAIDINPMQNPWMYKDQKQPTNASYNIENKGTFARGSDAVKIFEDYGFFWGGNFKDIKDYHHFERKTNGYEKYFEE